MTPQPVAQQPYVRRGYAAITSIIVILAVLVIVGTTTSILSIGNAQMSLGQSRSEQVRALVESCIEDVLLSYNNSGSIPNSVTTPLGSCQIYLDSSSPTSVAFTTTATIAAYNHSIQVTANRVSNVTIVNWIQTN